MTLVAGVDSSTQSCKVVVCDSDSGAVIRSGSAPHPDGTEVEPAVWLAALHKALEEAGGLRDVSAIAVAAQQHGMVCLDEQGAVVRPSLLWNDMRSAGAAADLIDELGGPVEGGRAWAEAVGSVPTASFTVTKLRWLAEHEPDKAARTASVCLPHDWLTWQLGGAHDGRELGANALSTDRGDASGTGYFSSATGSYRLDLIERAFGRVVEVPGILSSSEPAGQTVDGATLGCGTGDNAAAALGVLASPGDVIVSIGTSGTVFAVCDHPVADPTGVIAGFADATGRFLPLVCTVNAARVFKATARLLGVDQHDLSTLALQAPAGADGLVVVPYFEGERTPNRPFATGAVHGLRLGNSTPRHLARAAVEGVLCGLAVGLDALLAHDVRAERVIVIGGASRSEAVRRIAPGILGRPVVVPAAAQHVAVGAARQAAWALSGNDVAPEWSAGTSATYQSEPVSFVRARYAEVCEMTASVPTEVSVSL
ncbi:MAG TPA: xylulokinase [Acidimicrobiales bacterium]|nr:xylulokinase [Acidimicrobiales bacterium]